MITFYDHEGWFFVGMGVGTISGVWVLAFAWSFAPENFIDHWWAFPSILTTIIAFPAMMLAGGIAAVFIAELFKRNCK